MSRMALEDEAMDSRPATWNIRLPRPEFEWILNPWTSESTLTISQIGKHIFVSRILQNRHVIHHIVQFLNGPRTVFEARFVARLMENGSFHESRWLISWI